MKKLVRISKIISHSGICSRREAENLIENGSVRVNGEVFKEFVISDDVIKQISVLINIIKKKKKKFGVLTNPKDMYVQTKNKILKKVFLDSCQRIFQESFQLEGLIYHLKDY